MPARRPRWDPGHNDLIVAVQKWCRRHKVPYLHGCLWDRECRSFGAPPRIALRIGDTMRWVDLPGYYHDPGFPRRSWHGVRFGRYQSPL